MNKQIARILIKLCETGSIAISELSTVHRQYIRSLMETGVLTEKRKGRGLVVIVNNKQGLEEFIKKHFPHGLISDQAEGFTRSQAVSFWRNSKHGRLNSEPVVINARPGRLMKRDSEVLAVGQMTQTAGIAAFLLGEETDDCWQFDGTIALVENYEVFIHWQKTSIPADIAVWTAGRLSGRMMQWLKSSGMRNCKIIHCGDYDPVGLDEFCRLQKEIGERVTLHMPCEIDSFFSKYANPLLLQKHSSAKILARLRLNRHPDVLRIVNLIDTHNAGLEQEILLKAINGV